MSNAEIAAYMFGVISFIQAWWIKRQQKEIDRLSAHKEPGT